MLACLHGVILLGTIAFIKIISMLYKTKLHESFNFTKIAFRQLEVSRLFHSYAYHDPFVIKLVNDLQPGDCFIFSQ